MGRPRACQQTFSTPSNCIYIIPPSLSLSPPRSFLSGTDPGVFITLVISCCSVSTFPALVELAAAAAAAADIISRLATSLQLPFLSVLSAQQSGRIALVSRITHQGQAQVSAAGLTHVLTVRPRVRPRPLHLDVSLEMSLTYESRTRKAEVLCFVCIVCMPVFLRPNTKKHCSQLAVIQKCLVFSLQSTFALFPLWHTC